MRREGGCDWDVKCIKNNGKKKNPKRTCCVSALQDGAEEAAQLPLSGARVALLEDLACFCFCDFKHNTMVQPL